MPSIHVAAIIAGLSILSTPACARVVDPLIERIPFAHHAVEEAENVLEKRFICTQDNTLSIFKAMTEATPFCSGWIGVTDATTTTTITPMTTIVTVTATYTTGTLTTTTTYTTTTTDQVETTTYVIREKRAPALTPRAVLESRQDAGFLDLVKRELLGNVSVSDSASQESVFEFHVSSACTCLNISASTMTTTATDTQFVTERGAYELTDTVTTTTAFTTETVTELSTETVHTGSSTIPSSANLPSSTQTIIGGDFTCPEDDHLTKSVLVDNERFDYVIFCDQIAVSETSRIAEYRLGTSIECASACSNANNQAGAPKCQSWTYDSTVSEGLNCFLYSTIESLTPAIGRLTAELTAVSVGTNSSNATVTWTEKDGTISSVLSSISEHGVMVTPAPSLNLVANYSGATSSCWSSNTTLASPSGAIAWSWACSSTSSWYQSYYAQFIQVYSIAIVEVISGSGGNATSGAGGGENGGGGIVVPTATGPASNTLVISTVVSSRTAYATLGATGGGGIYFPTATGWNSTLLIPRSSVTSGEIGTASYGSGIVIPTIVSMVSGLNFTFTSALSSESSGQTAGGTGGNGIVLPPYNTVSYWNSSQLSEWSSATSGIMSGATGNSGIIFPTAPPSSIPSSNATVVPPVIIINTTYTESTVLSSATSGQTVGSTGGGGIIFPSAPSSAPFLNMTTVILNTTTALITAISSATSGETVMSTGGFGIITPALPSMSSTFLPNASLSNTAGNRSAGYSSSSMPLMTAPLTTGISESSSVLPNVSRSNTAGNRSPYPFPSSLPLYTVPGSMPLYTAPESIPLSTGTGGSSFFPTPSSESAPFPMSNSSSPSMPTASGSSPLIPSGVFPSSGALSLPSMSLSYPSAPLVTAPLSIPSATASPISESSVDTASNSSRSRTNTGGFRSGSYSASFSIPLLSTGPLPTPPLTTGPLSSGPSVTGPLSETPSSLPPFPANSSLSLPTFPTASPSLCTCSSLLSTVTEISVVTSVITSVVTTVATSTVLDISCISTSSPLSTSSSSSFIPPSLPPYGPIFTGPAFPAASPFLSSSPGSSTHSPSAAPSSGRSSNRRGSGQLASSEQILSACITAAGSASPTNVLENPGFELVDASTPPNAAYWQVAMTSNAQAADTFSAALDVDQHTLNGSYVGRVTQSSSVVAGGNETVQFCQTITLCPNTTYTLSVYTRQSTEVPQCTASVAYGPLAIGYASPGRAWELSSWPFLTPETVLGVSQDLTVAVQCGGSGERWMDFDDFELLMSQPGIGRMRVPVPVQPRDGRFHVR